MLAIENGVAFENEVFQLCQVLTIKPLHPTFCGVGDLCAGKICRSVSLCVYEWGTSVECALSAERYRTRIAYLVVSVPTWRCVVVSLGGVEG